MAIIQPKKRLAVLVVCDKIWATTQFIVKTLGFNGLSQNTRSMESA
jgi:hypothetical protein